MYPPQQGGPYAAPPGQFQPPQPQEQHYGYQQYAVPPTGQQQQAPYGPAVHQPYGPPSSSAQAYGPPSNSGPPPEVRIGIRQRPGRRSCRSDRGSGSRARLAWSRPARQHTYVRGATQRSGPPQMPNSMGGPPPPQFDMPSTFSPFNLMTGACLSSTTDMRRCGSRSGTCPGWHGPGAQGPIAGWLASHAASWRPALPLALPQAACCPTGSSGARSTCSRCSRGWAGSRAATSTRTSTSARATVSTRRCAPAPHHAPRAPPQGPERCASKAPGAASAPHCRLTNGPPCWAHL
jgi:hypothetical protein